MRAAAWLLFLLSVFQILSMPVASAAAEDLRGTMYMVQPADVTLYGKALDLGNPTNDNLQVRVCWDDANNCDKPLRANGISFPPTISFPATTCTSTAAFICHGFTYLIPTGQVGTVTPRDGNSHQMFVKIISPTNPGAGDKLVDGSPWPFTFKNGTVAPMWAPNLETSPSRLTASQLAVFANSQDPYSVGSGGATVCTVNGTAIKNDGVVGYYVQKHNVPCGNVYVFSLPSLKNCPSPPSSCYISQALLESTVLATKLPDSIQAIAIGWVNPAQVSPTIVTEGQRSISAVIANGKWMRGSSCFEGDRNLMGQGPINAYFNTASKAPFTDYGLRPTMILAGEACATCQSNNYQGPWVADVASAKATIDAAVAAVDTDPLGGNVYWTLTLDSRSQTALLVSPLLLGSGLSLKVNAQILDLRKSSNPFNVSTKNILMYDEASPNFTYTGSNFLPGAGIGFSVTSTSGFLPYDGNQTNASVWLKAGAVAAFGSAIEPCELLTYKHPDPALAIAHYLQGQTVVEALWKSVRLPWNGNFVGDPLASPFSLAPGAPGTGPRISPGGAVNAASFVQGPLSPGAVFTVFGANLGPAVLAGLQLDSSGRVATSTGGTRVLVNGIPAPMIYSLAGQVSAVLPFATPPNTTAQVVVEYNGIASAAESVAVADASPALFTIDSSGKGQGAILNQTGTVNGLANPAQKGSVVVLYATGAGLTDIPSVDGDLTAGVYPKPLQPVSVTIGGQQAVLNYAGAAPGLLAGVLQVNAVVPTAIASGAQPIVLQVGSAVSPAGVTVAIQ